MVAGVDDERTVPFADTPPPSFRCILTWPLSTGPDALRFSCGIWGAPFAPPTGRGAGLGAPAGVACLDSIAGDLAVLGSI
jgi:hypothetical protein